MHTYPIHIAGLERQLPICRVTDDLYIGAFICFGDAELTVACARELLKLAPAESYDYLLTAEAKSIPLIHEMARQSGAKKYFIARKGPKAYMPDPIHVEDTSITTAGTQRLYLGVPSTPWRNWWRWQAASWLVGWRCWQRAMPRSGKTSNFWRRCRCSTRMER